MKFEYRTDSSRSFFVAAAAVCSLGGLLRITPFIDASWFSFKSLVVSQLVVLINMLGWIRFARALTGSNEGTSRTGEVICFYLLKSAAICGAALWIAVAGVAGLTYLCAGAVAQLGLVCLMASLRLSPRSPSNTGAGEFEKP